MCDEYPQVKSSFRGPVAYDATLEAGMLICIESYIEAVGERDVVKLEEKLLGTSNGYAFLTYPLEERLCASICLQSFWQSRHRWSRGRRCRPHCTAPQRFTPKHVLDMASCSFDKAAGNGRQNGMPNYRVGGPNPFRQDVAPFTNQDVPARPARTRRAYAHISTDEQTTEAIELCAAGCGSLHERAPRCARKWAPDPSRPPRSAEAERLGQSGLMLQGLRSIVTRTQCPSRLLDPSPNWPNKS